MSATAQDRAMYALKRLSGRDDHAFPEAQEAVKAIVDAVLEDPRFLEVIVGLRARKG